MTYTKNEWIYTIFRNIFRKKLKYYLNKSVPVKLALSVLSMLCSQEEKHQNNKPDFANWRYLKIHFQMTAFHICFS